MTNTLSSRGGLSRRVFAAGLAGVASLAVPVLRAQGSNRILLGQSAAFTGAAAQLGIQFHAGAKLFFDRYNADGPARRVEIEPLDDGYEPDRCADNTRKLLDKEVFALFGYIGTPTSVVALPLATKAEMPFIAPFTGAMSLRQPFNRMAFHLRASYNDETELIVKNLHNLGLTRVAVFYQNDAYGKAGLDGTLLALASRGLKPVAMATVERNTVDVAAAVTTINAANPQAVVQISAYKSCAAYIRAARARPAMAAASTTCPSWARRRWPMNWARRARAWSCRRWYPTPSAPPSPSPESSATPSPRVAARYRPISPAWRVFSRPGW